MRADVDVEQKEKKFRQYISKKVLEFILSRIPFFFVRIFHPLIPPRLLGEARADTEVEDERR